MPPAQVPAPPQAARPGIPDDGLRAGDETAASSTFDSERGSRTVQSEPSGELSGPGESKRQARWRPRRVEQHDERRSDGVLVLPVDRLEPDLRLPPTVADLGDRMVRFQSRAVGANRRPRFGAANRAFVFDHRRGTTKHAKKAPRATIIEAMVWPASPDGSSGAKPMK